MTVITHRKPKITIIPSMDSPKQSRRVGVGLLSYNQIPAWYQDNEYVLHGYRPVSYSTSSCFRSWSYFHNETVNIYTHLLPAILSIFCQALAYRYFALLYPEATSADRLVFAFFFFTAATCLGLSATYHTMMNHSEHVSHLWLRLDFVGIVVLTLGDFVSGIYVVFYCEPALQKTYWSMILTLGLLTVVILVSPRFQGKRWRTFRVCTFVGTGMSGFAPLAHGLKVFGLEQMRKQSGISYYLVEGGLLVLGALFYATRIPESLKPGRFDIWGCSHQIFHVLVVAATGVHLLGISSAFDYNYHNRKCGA